MNIEIAAKQLEAIGNVTRLSIFRVLVQAGKSGIPVGTIQKNLKIPASTLSHHIAKLVQAELVTQERDSRTLFCRANYNSMDALIGFLVENCCQVNFENHD